MNEKTPKNPRGAGRVKYIGKRYPVISHPRSIERVRSYSMQLSKIEYEKDLRTNDQQRNS